jgi:hypothetical protein
MRAVVHDRYGLPDVLCDSKKLVVPTLAGVQTSSQDPGRTP